MLQAAHHVNGKIMWANLHLLFWLSLVPFTTGWMGENHFAPLPTALYGIVMFGSAISYTVLQSFIIANHKDEDRRLASAAGNDLKGKISILLYATAIALAFVNQWISDAIYVSVAAIWFIPDRRIERRIDHQSEH